MTSRGRGKGRVFAARGTTPSTQATSGDGHGSRNSLIAAINNTQRSLVDEEETQPPDDLETEFDGSLICQTQANKKARGKYKCIKVDLKTHGGRVKLSVNMANDVDRVIGQHARDFVNYCGYIVRTTVPLDEMDWKKVYEKVGESMWRHIESRFEYPEDEGRFKNCAVATMRRLYSSWKNKLHKHYLKFETDLQRLDNRPAELNLAQWKSCIKHFNEEEFKAKSQRNSINALKRKQIHTTGNVSFAEDEEKMVDPITGNKPTLDEIWFRQHARKTDDGELDWADNMSKEIGEKLKNMVETSSQASTPMTKEEMYDQAMGVRSGYRRGFGHGKKGFSKRICLDPPTNEVHEREVNELKETVAVLEEKLLTLEENRKEQEKQMQKEIRDQVMEEFRQLLERNRMSFPSFPDTESDPQI